MSHILVPASVSQDPMDLVAFLEECIKRELIAEKSAEFYAKYRREENSLETIAEEDIGNRKHPSSSCESNSSESDSSHLSGFMCNRCVPNPAKRMFEMNVEDLDEEEVALRALKLARNTVEVMEQKLLLVKSCSKSKEQKGRSFGPSAVIVDIEMCDTAGGQFENDKSKHIGVVKKISEKSPLLPYDGN